MESTRKMSATDFRKNMFRLLDECIEKGEVIEIERRGGLVRIVPQRRKYRIEDLPPHPGAVREPETLDSFSPSEWKP